jgi:quinol monooxygenase YgiN
MFSLTSRIVALPGMRDALAETLLKGCMDLLGCLSYVVVNDPNDANAFWINEVWETEAIQRAALSLPRVKHATSGAMLMIAAVGDGRPSYGI